jgi:SH3-like domain-containing protein
MGERNYWTWLVPGVRLATEYMTRKGQMVSFVIRLEKLREDDEWRLAARYDTCHGWPHLDVVNGRGELVLKRWMEERDIGEAFQQALLDFKKNHEKYK